MEHFRLRRGITFEQSWGKDKLMVPRLARMLAYRMARVKPLSGATRDRHIIGYRGSNYTFQQWIDNMTSDATFLFTRIVLDDCQNFQGSSGSIDKGLLSMK
jgi:hypothetical protein